MPYSDKVLDHFHRPRNAGSFPEGGPDVGTGRVGSPNYGEMIQLQLRILEGRIADVRFKAVGSGAAIACASYVTELVRGKTLEEALAVRNSEIARELSLPAVKIHSSVLAEEAIRAAVEDYRNRRGTIAAATALKG